MAVLEDSHETAKFQLGFLILLGHICIYQVFDQPVSWVGKLGRYFHYKQSSYQILFF